MIFIDLLTQKRNQNDSFIITIGENYAKKKYFNDIIPSYDCEN